MIAALFVILALAAVLAVQGAQSGAIVSAQWRCAMPCEENWALYISRSNTADLTDNMLQQLLPPAPAALRSSIEVFTSYNPDTREFAVVTADVPVTAAATFWTSTVSNDINSVTPVKESVVVNYPTSSSPFPLNVAHLKLVRIFHGPEGALFGVYSNGEIHAIDLENKQSKLTTRLISDERLLSTEYPAATWSHAYDSASRELYSVTMGGVNAYLVRTNMETFTVSDWLPLSMPKGANSGFAPQTFINAHMMQVQPNTPAQFVILTESLSNVGFDQINAVNTTSGVMTAYEFNLMDSGIEFTCPEFECDKWRVSAWDADSRTLYFQGHMVTDTVLAQLTFDDAKASGNLRWYIDTPLKPSNYGFTGMYYVKSL